MLRLAVLKKLLDSPFIGPLTAMILATLLVALTTDRFLDAGNLNNIVLQFSIVSIVAVGSTVVIFTGGIDFSPGAMIALLTMVLAVVIKFLDMPFAVALLLILCLGALLGALNGALTAYARLPAFLVTLVALNAYRGVAFTFNNGSPVFSLHPLFESLFYGRLLGIPLPLFYVFILYGFAFSLIRHTRIGRELYAVGGNTSGDPLPGTRARRIQCIAFMMAGAMAAVGAMLIAARLNSGSPNYGTGLELQAIAAAVIGGASLAGGRGHILNTLLGALTVVIVQNGLSLNAVPTSLQSAIIGLLILIAVGIDLWRTAISQLLNRFTRFIKSNQ